MGEAAAAWGDDDGDTDMEAIVGGGKNDADDDADGGDAWGGDVSSFTLYICGQLVQCSRVFKRIKDPGNQRQIVDRANPMLWWCYPGRGSGRHGSSNGARHH